MIGSGRPDETQANKIQKPNKKETTTERGNPLYSEIPEWLQEFRENLVDDEIPQHGDSHASSSHEVSLEPTFKRREDLGKHSVYTHLPEDRNCEICQRTKITRAPCRRRNGGSRTSCWKFWWLDNSRPQGPKRQLRVSKQSSIRSRGTGSSYSMDPGVSRAKTKLHKKPREAWQKFLEPERKQKVIYHWQFLRIRKRLWRSLLESLHVYTTPIGRLMVLPKEQCAE